MQQVSPIHQYGIMPDNHDVLAVTITNNKGMSAEICEYGARILALRVPDKSGREVNVVLGLPDLAAYLKDSACFGAIIGRNANRIANGTFSISGHNYELPRNDGNNNNHSGPHGFEQQCWHITSVKHNSVRLCLYSPHLSQGMPGNAYISATYSLEDSLALQLTLEAVCDQSTIMNMTSHTYWNLEGPGCNTACNHVLQVFSDSYYPTDSSFIPMCKTSVDNTPFDFRKGRKIHTALIDTDQQILMAHGLNHAFMCNAEYQPQSESVFPMLRYYAPHSGIEMMLSSNMPSLLIYSGGFLHNIEGNMNRIYDACAGLVFEPGFVPNAINKPQEISPVLQAGETYSATIRYEFFMR